MRNKRKKTIKAGHAVVSTAGVIGYVFGILLCIVIGRAGIKLARESADIDTLCRILLWQAIFFIIILASGHIGHKTAICATALFIRGVLAGYSSTYLLRMQADLLYFMHTAVSVLVMTALTSAARVTMEKRGVERAVCVFFLLGITQAAVIVFYLTILAILGI